MKALVLAILLQIPQPPPLEPVFRQAVAQRLKQYGPKHPKYAASLVDLGLFLKSEKILLQALAIAPSAATEPVLTLLGDIRAEQQKFAEAEALYRRAIPLADGERLANAYNNLAIVLEAQQKPSEEFYAKAAAAYEKALGPNHPEVASVLINLAGVIADKTAAERLLERALRILKSTVGPSHPRVNDACEALFRVSEHKKTCP